MRRIPPEFLLSFPRLNRLSQGSSELRRGQQRLVVAPSEKWNGQPSVNAISVVCRTQKVGGTMSIVRIENVGEMALLNAPGLFSEKQKGLLV
jgi:hypothetical protein